MKWTIEELRNKFRYEVAKEDETRFVQVWNMIGDNYRIDAFYIATYLVIPDNLYEKIKMETKDWFEKDFWSYKPGSMYIITESEFRRAKKKYESKGRAGGGIYGIYKDGELVYIGYTKRDMRDRIREHQDIVYGRAKKPKNMRLYNVISKHDNLQWRALIFRDQLKASGVTERDMKAMELALITLFQPEGNLQGVTMDYKF